MIDIKDIPDRATVRFNDEEKLIIHQLSRIINEQDLSKILKFGMETALHHVKFVTEALVTPEWEVLFMRKRKSSKLDRKVY